MSRTAHERPTVLILAGRYLPGFRAGGPIRSIANLVAALGHSWRFRIVAYDRDLGATEPYPGIDHAWSAVGEADVRYVAPGASGAVSVVKLLQRERYDLMYLTTFFDPTFGLLPLALRRLGVTCAGPVVVSPRGQFAPGALGLRSQRKAIAMAVMRAALLRGDEHWHATSRSEVDDIARAIPEARDRITMVPNVPGASAGCEMGSAYRQKEVGVVRAIFLGRVARNKGLADAIRFCDGVVGRVAIDVVGAIEDEAYWAECLTLVAHARADLTVRACGPIAPDLVGETIHRYDLLYLPTHGENFGHAIFESLAAGRPVLVSDRTPWRDLTRRRAGWDISLDAPELFRQALQWMVDADESAVAPLSAGARTLAATYLATDTASEETDAMFRRLLAPRHRGGA